MAGGVLIASLSSAQEFVSQQQYEGLSACHGKLTGSQGVAARALPLFEGEANYDNLAEILRSGDDISSNMNTNLRFFEERDTALDRAAG